MKLSTTFYMCKKKTKWLEMTSMFMNKPFDINYFGKI